MLEILLIIWVVKRFKQIAENKGYTRWVWGLIGALSYYVPIILMSFLILPAMITNGIVDFSNYSEIELKLLIILINLVTGVLCCMLTYHFMSKLPDKTNTATADLLDDWKQE